MFGKMFDACCFFKSRYKRLKLALLSDGAALQ